MKRLRSESEDTRNRGLRKTLIFKNIPFQQQRYKESRDEIEEILAKEVIKLLPEFQVNDIIKKTERAHRSKESEFSEIPAIIGKFTDWDLMEKIKSGFIKSKSSIDVSQMYSPALTKRRNKAMIARKDLKRLYPSIQAFVKYPAKQSNNRYLDLPLIKALFNS